MKHDQASKKTKFMAIKPKAISAAHLVKTAYLQPHAALPLVIEPGLDHVDLIEWAKTNRQALDAELLKYGALLFRGFRLQSVLEFERFIRAISSELIDYSYRSTRVQKSTEKFTHRPHIQQPSNRFRCITKCHTRATGR